MSGLPLSSAAASTPMCRALTGWIVLAVALIGAGLGAVLGAQHGQVRELPPDTIRQWRAYAGAGVALLALLLALDLLRFRAKHVREPGPPGA